MGRLIGVECVVDPGDDLLFREPFLKQPVHALLVLHGQKPTPSPAQNEVLLYLLNVLFQRINSLFQRIRRLIAQPPVFFFFIHFTSIHFTSLLFSRNFRDIPGISGKFPESDGTSRIKNHGGAILRRRIHGLRPFMESRLVLLKVPDLDIQLRGC